MQPDLQLPSARSCDATAQGQPPLAACTGADLVQTVFDGVQGTFRLCTVLHRRTLRSHRFNWFAFFTPVSCSWHSVRPAHPSGAWQACVHRRNPSCLEQSPWRCSEHLTSLNSAGKRICLYNHTIHRLGSVELSLTNDIPISFSVRHPCNVYWHVTAPYKSLFYYYYYY